jgi:DNA-binding SARP family transcriptional activator
VADAAPAELGHRLDGARMFIVGHEPAADLLGVLAAARTEGDHLRPGADGDERFRTEAPAVPAPIAVSLLGTYRIEAGGEEVRSGLRAKARELLAFYLLHPEGTTLDAATEALWPDADRGRGPEWFWTALGNLRSRLRAVTGERQLKVIERDGDIYRIEPVFDVDLWRLQQALTDAAASDDDAARTVAFDRAAQEYGGELLAGVDWLWAETPRDDLRQRMVDVLVWLGDVRWASGDTRGSWQALQRALEVDPLAEQVYRRVMRLQAKLSRPDDADVTFRRLQARLEEVGLEPSPESEKLRVDLCGSA